MTFKMLRNLRLSTQLHMLVAVSLLLAGGLIAYSLIQLRSTQGTLKFTIDNRMASMQSLNEVSGTLMLAQTSATDVLDRTLDPLEARESIAKSLSKAHDQWDQYFLAKMIPEEQALADETTPVLDKAFSAIDKLQDMLRKKDFPGLAELRSAQLIPAVSAARKNLEQLGALQMVAANQDQQNAQRAYQVALRNSIALLVCGALVSIGAALLIIRGAMSRLGSDPAQAARIARRIAAGDLTFVIEPGRNDGESLMGALRQMKDNLLHSRLDYEGQINAISRAEGVVEFTPDGTMLSANENFQRIVGYGLEELKGKHHGMLLGAAERENPAYRQFWERMAQGEFRQGTHPRLTRDGREIWIRGTYNPILDATGKPFKIVKYCSDVTSERQEAQMNAAFRGALGKLSASVMVANNQGDIVYLNDALKNTMAAAQADIRTELPDFDALKLVGQNVEMFLQGTAHQRGMLEQATSTCTTQIVLGGRTLKLIANPMYDDTGRRLGTVIEWFDRTQELATEVELQEIITAVTAGNLEDRISLRGKSGFFETLSVGINSLVDSVATIVGEVQTLVAGANDGDLSRRMNVEGRAGLFVKIGTDINDLLGNMSSVIAQVKEVAVEVYRGADEISQGNSNLSQRTEEQASSLEQTASSMEEMTATVKQNADSAAHANQLAVAARDQAQKGGAVVAKAVRAMSDINEASRKIADIIGVIDEIAFQTNLLALNAAVEAARAGEQGRGFAVVATEVRNLAGRSATAAKEIKLLIQNSVRKVEDGSTLVTQSGETLEQIVSAVQKVTDIVAEISAASHEQSAGIEQVNKAVMQLDELTQQNAALVEQAAAASNSMADQARALNDTMALYRVDGGAASAERPRESGASGVDRRGGGRPWDSSQDSATRRRFPAAAVHFAIPSQ